MDCPSCTKTAFQSMRAYGIELDKCGFCGGVWFDAGELEAFRSGEAVSEGRAYKSAVFSPSSMEARACPGCRARSLVFGSVENVPLFSCNACGGAFLPPRPQTDVADAAAWIVDADDIGDVVGWSVELLRHLVEALHHD